MKEKTKLSLLFGTLACASTGLAVIFQTSDVVPYAVKGAFWLSAAVSTGGFVAVRKTPQQKFERSNLP